MVLITTGQWKGWVQEPLTIDHSEYYWRKIGKYTIKSESGYFRILDEKGIYQNGGRAYLTVKEAIESVGPDFGKPTKTKNPTMDIKKILEQFEK